MILAKEIRGYLYSKADDFLTSMQGCDLYVRNRDNTSFEIRFEKLVLCDKEINNHWIKLQVNIGIRDLQFDNVKPEDLVIGFSVTGSFLMYNVDDIWFKYRGYSHYSGIKCWSELDTAIVAEKRTYEYFKDFYGPERILCKFEELDFKKIDLLFERIKTHYFECVEPEIKEKADVNYLNKIINTPYDNYIHTNDFQFSGDRVMRKLVLAKLANNPDYSKIYETLKKIGDETWDMYLNDSDDEIKFSAKNFNVRVNKIYNDLNQLDT